MKILSRFQVRFFKPDKGATAVEYALIVGLIAVVLIVGVSVLGTGLNNTFRDVACNITSGGKEEWVPESTSSTGAVTPGACTLKTP